MSAKSIVNHLANKSKVLGGDLKDAKRILAIAELTKMAPKLPASHGYDDVRHQELVCASSRQTRSQFHFRLWPETSISATQRYVRS